MSAKKRLFIEFGINIVVSFFFPIYWGYIYFKSNQFAKKNFLVDSKVDSKKIKEDVDYQNEELRLKERKSKREAKHLFLPDN